jgi:hypothetical protein
MICGLWYFRIDFLSVRITAVCHLLVMAWSRACVLLPMFVTIGSQRRVPDLRQLQPRRRATPQAVVWYMRLTLLCDRCTRSFFQKFCWSKRKIFPARKTLRTS